MKFHRIFVSTWKIIHIKLKPRSVSAQHKGSKFSISLRKVSVSELLMLPAQEMFNANQNCAGVEPSGSIRATVRALAAGAVRMRTCSTKYLTYTPRYKCSVLFRDDCLRMQPFDKARLAMHQVQSWLYNHFVRFSLSVCTGTGWERAGGLESCTWRW
jgi:hypothetical protein